MPMKNSAPLLSEYSKEDKSSLDLIYLDHSRALPPYVSKNTTKTLLVRADIKSSKTAPPIDWVLLKLLLCM